MRLSDIKGAEAFKAMGKVIGCLKRMFDDKELGKIANEKKQGWLLDFFSTSLEKRSDIWMDLFLTLNPDTKAEDVSIGSVIKFAYDFKNDPELMSLFFSQSEQTESNSIGSLTENTKETEKR